MGRSTKAGVDYFPHDTLACLRPTLHALQNKFGNDGYAFWFKLWEFIGTKRDLYADFSSNHDWLYFLSIADVDEEKGNEILNTLVELDAIDAKLWNERRIVWSDNFQERIAFVYNKRGIAIPHKPFSSDETQKKDDDNPFDEYG